MGAQAGQNRGVQSPASRRDRHQLRAARRRPRRSCRSVRYCITLDSDTRLPRDTARHLIGIITHPLNRPCFNPAIGRVTEGYGILQPRVSVTFTSAAGSLFARLYAGHTGVDPYTTAVSDTYQDVFGEGIFTGKGLYDIDAFTAALEGWYRRTRCFRTTSSKACTRASRSFPTWSWSTSILERARARPTAAPMDPRRLADPAVAVPLCPDAPRHQTQFASADLALENPRQPPAQSCRPDAARAPGGRLDGTARRPLVLDGDGTRRDGGATPAPGRPD